MEAPPVRTVTVEDDRRYRGSLEDLLRSTGDFDVVGSFGTADAALASLPDADEEGWDLVLMDVELPGTRGIEATRRLKEDSPDSTVVVLTVFEEPSVVLEAICAGADGYLAKRCRADEILEELRSVVAGGSPLSPGVARTVVRLLRRLGGAPASDAQATVAPDAERDSTGGTSARGADRVGLTDREREVLGCLVEGLPYRQVGERLGISHNTVRSHVRSLYGKLQVHNVAQAVSRALREGLV